MSPSQPNMFGQCGGHVGAAGTRLADQQFDGGRAEQVFERHLGVVGVEPRVLVARRADELRGGRVVRAATHPFDGQARARDHPGGDLGELAERVGRQRAGRDDAVGRRVVDHRAVGAHRHRREAQRVDDRPDPARRAAGGEHELRARIDRGAHGVAGAWADLLVVVEQRAVHVGGDQRRQVTVDCGVSALGPLARPLGELRLVEHLASASVGARAAEPPRHPVRALGVRVVRCTVCSSVVIASRIAASAPRRCRRARSAAPTDTVIGILLRPNDFGWSFVHIRCAPQTISGMIGT